MRGRTKKITYAAVCTAIAVCCMLFAQLLSLKTPLLICSLCFYLALEKSGVSLGLVSTAASILLILAFGFFTTALLTLIIFAPYAVIAYSERKLSYKNAKQAIIRVAISIAFANLALVCCYYMANLLMPEIDFTKAINALGGYAILAILVSLFFIATDFFFRQLCLTFQRLIR